MTARARDTAGGGEGRAHGAVSSAARTQADTRPRGRGRADKLVSIGEHLREVGVLLLDLAEEVLAVLAVTPEQSVHARVEARVEESPLIGIKEIAERVGVSEKTVRRMRERGDLPPAIDLGSVIRWRPEVIEQWLAEREEEAQ